MNVGDEQIETRFGNVFYPTVVRAKGSSQVVTNQSSRRKRIQTCRQCGGTGHNKRSCMFASYNGGITGATSFVHITQQINNSPNMDDNYNYQWVLIFFYHSSHILLSSLTSNKTSMLLTITFVVYSTWTIHKLLLLKASAGFDAGCQHVF